MKFNFDEKIIRRGTNSIKWDVKENELPLWVADMDFKTAPCIIEALKNRVEHGVFGYADIDDEWRDAIVNWWKKRHNHRIEKDSLMFSIAAIPSFASILRALTRPGERVLLQSPCYNAFFNIIRNNGRLVEENPLTYKDGRYSIDFEDLEKRLSKKDVTLFILCNPHNPTGNIWTRDELKRIAEIAKREDVIVISDELHCDLTDPGLSYVPYASSSQVAYENSITLISPTKTFNLAGIKSSALYTNNSYLLQKLKRALNNDEVGEPNAFASLALVSAYTKGEEWLDELRSYLYENKKHIKSYLEKHFPKVKIVNGGATYLLWIDISAYTKDSSLFSKALREEEGVVVSDGIIFGQETGKGFFRLNIATRREIIDEFLERFASLLKRQK